MSVNVFHDNTTSGQGFIVTPRHLTPKQIADGRRKAQRSAIAFAQRGRQAAESLASWLNVPQEADLTLNRSLVLQGIERLREMSKLKAAGTNPDDSPCGRSLQRARRALLSILSTLAPMKWTLLPLGQGYAIDLEHPTLTELAFLCLADITQAGLLDRLRRCRQCGKWFAARRAKKSFCSPDCQQEFWSEYRKTPQGLEEQRKRMSHWRAQQRSRKSKRRRKQ
jgi:hypothetical protein